MTGGEGRMTWNDALGTVLEGAECVWQDLDGIHLEPPPQLAPPTSLLWAWPAEDAPGQLVRLRLDDQLAYVALRPLGEGESGEQLATWSTEDARVASVRFAGQGGGLAGLMVEQFREPVGSQGQIPVTFYRVRRTGTGASRE